MSLTESIKEELDRECAQEKQAKSISQCEVHDIWSGSLITDCFRCHKHDALASRIADRVTEVRT